MTTRSFVTRTLAALAGLGLLTSAGAAMPPSVADSTARGCAHPAFVTHGASGGRPVGRYYLDPDLWNVAGYRYRQTMRVCAPGNWAATVTTDDRAHDGAVKAYPNIHRDYIDWSSGHMPALGSFTSIISSFASRQPGSGVYDTAYDIWLNGVADAASDEVMIWTHNQRQHPSGAVVQRGLRFSGRTWRLYATTGNHYLALVPARPLDRGRIDLRSVLRRLVALDRLPSHSRLGQICFGFELVSTNGRAGRFKVDRFAVHATRR